MSTPLTPSALQTILADHAIWLAHPAAGQRANLRGANLRGVTLHLAQLSHANLQNADLRGAVLRGSRFRGADLQGADLRGADLRGGQLRTATLRGADLRGTDLRSANLIKTDLRDARLVGADIDGAVLGGATLAGASLPTGETWEQYCTIVIPALCTAGGQPLAVVAASWTCHDWTNCPMTVAFGVQALEDIPHRYQARARQFLQFFDAELVPNPLTISGDVSVACFSL